MTYSRLSFARGLCPCLHSWLLTKRQASNKLTWGKTDHNQQEEWQAQLLPQLESLKHQMFDSGNHSSCVCVKGTQQMAAFPLFLFKPAKNTYPQNTAQSTFKRDPRAGSHPSGGCLTGLNRPVEWIAASPKYKNRIGPLSQRE